MSGILDAYDDQMATALGYKRGIRDNVSKDVPRTGTSLVPPGFHSWGAAHAREEKREAKQQRRRR